MRQVMTLGKLLNLEVYDPATKRTTKRVMTGKWLATSPHGRDLLICTVRSTSAGRTQQPNAQVAARHRKFHGQPPKGTWVGECPEPVGALRQVGLLKALTYAVPGSKIRSPEKNPYHWHHAFGDTGHKGGTYPASVYPAVMKDTRGNLFIRRRPGNIFKTTDWIRG